MVKTLKRTIAGIVTGAIALVPMISLAAFVAPTAPDVGTGLLAKISEVITSAIQYPFDVLGTGSNFYVVGLFMLGVIALAIVGWLRRKATLGHR